MTFSHVLHAEMQIHPLKLEPVFIRGECRHPFNYVQ